MLILLKQEWKLGLKNFLIWTFAIGGMGLVCIILYKSMESEMQAMAESFASMGTFSTAFGMDTLSMATVKGYFATEVGTIHALGGSMFAASIATVILSKEEDGHTAEFTYTLPISRGKIVGIKLTAVLSSLFLFTIICGLFYEIGFFFVGEKTIGKEFLIYMGSQFLMDVEVASVCFLISACSKKNKIGVGIGIAMMLYLYDLMARVIPDLKDYIMIGPFSYGNASEIFSKTADNAAAYGLGISVIVMCMIAAFAIYTKRDLAS